MRSRFTSYLHDYHSYKGMYVAPPIFLDTPSRCIKYKLHHGRGIACRQEEKTKKASKRPVHWVKINCDLELLETSCSVHWQIFISISPNSTRLQPSVCCVVVSGVSHFPLDNSPQTLNGVQVRWIPSRANWYYDIAKPVSSSCTSIRAYQLHLLVNEFGEFDPNVIVNILNVGSLSVLCSFFQTVQYFTSGSKVVK